MYCILWCLFLGTGKKGTGGSGNTGEGDEEKTSDGSGGKADEGDLHAIDDEEALGTGEDGGQSKEGGGTDVEGTGDGGEEEGGGLDEEGGDAVDEELLVVGDEGEGAELLELGEGGLEGGEVDPVLLELGEDAELGGLAEEVELTDAADDVVLQLVSIEERGVVGNEICEMWYVNECACNETAALGLFRLASCKVYCSLDPAHPRLGQK